MKISFNFCHNTVMLLYNKQDCQIGNLACYFLGNLLELLGVSEQKREYFAPQKTFAGAPVLHNSVGSALLVPTV